ncbi:MAG: extracellular solute-binding protein [Clostridiales bacterium]|nr:extracellular solute-binding protein [Clostridiales bacterium]
MRKRKVILSLVLVFILCLSVLAGCGQTATTNGSSTQAAGAATTASTAGDAAAATSAADGTAATAAAAFTLPITADKVELTLWKPWPPFFSAYMTDPADGTVFPELEKRTNVKIKMISVSTETLMETFSLMIASGEYPDMVCSATSFYKGGGDKAISDNFVLKLNDLVDSSMPNYKKVLEENPDYKKGATTDSGNIAGVYNFTKKADGYTIVQGAVIRQDWLDSLNMQKPVTYDDWYTTLKAFKEQKGAVSPLWLMYAGVPYRDGLIQGYGVAGCVLNAGFNTEDPFYAVDGKVKFGPVEPGFKEYITMVNKWYTDGLISQDCFTYKDDINGKEEFLINGKSGIWYTNSQGFEDFEKKASDTNYHITALADPVKTAGDKVHFAGMEEALQGDSISITTACKTPEIAAKYLDYMFTEEGSILANYGIEGQSFTYVDGKPRYTDVVLNNKDIPMLQAAQTKFSMTHFPMIVDTDRDRVGYTEDQKAASGIWKNNGNADNAYYITSSVALSADESMEYSTTYSDISTYASEMIVKFIMGREPMSKFDAFVAQINSMGIDKCIALKQAALDRYNSRK